MNTGREKTASQECTSECGQLFTNSIIRACRGLHGDWRPEFPNYLTHLVLRDKPLPKNA